MKKVKMLLCAMLCLMLVILSLTSCKPEPEVVGISKVEVNSDGHLIVTMTNGETQDAGRVVGEDGLTPHIGENGNWFIGEKDTGVAAKGKDGVDGEDGTDGKDGADGKDSEAKAEFIFDNDGNGTVLLAYVGTAENVVIPEGTTAIARDAFANNKVMKSLTIPGSVKRVTAGIVWNCMKLERVEFKQGVQIIETGAIMGAIPFDPILHEGLIEIQDYALGGAKYQTTVIPSSVQQLGSSWYMNQS